MSSDIEAYFTRIGYSGPRQPTIAMLREIVAKHPAAIPFENLDVLLGRVPPLDPGSLHDKLIRHRRGGYCFEHNTLLMSVLRATGFEVAGLAARVRACARGARPTRSGRAPICCCGSIYRRGHTLPMSGSGA
jgi:N-hydroxyarylamine O-acetyltransferase